MATKLAPTEEPEVSALSGGVLSVIARAASDPNVDVDKLERLLAMQERILSREAEQAFNEAMRKAQADIEPVIKNKVNPQTRSEYADLVALSEAMDPIIHENGFTLSYGTDASPLPDHYRVTCLVAHIGGYSRDYHADVPIDMTGIKGERNKTTTHGWGSAMTYGRRYLKVLIFDVTSVIKDDDGNRAGRGSTINAEQLQQLQRLADEVGADLQRFCRYMKVDSLAAIPARDFARARSALEAKRTAK